jgi:DNA-directed RNA polymerase II subunit RPB1
MEMNVFLPQSLQTQIELEEIAGVERQIISPTSSKTIIGIVQDGLVGAYNLTAPTVRIDWRNAMNIMSYTSLEDFSSLKKNKDYTGHELYTLIMPTGVSVDKANLKIKNGVFTEGRLTKEYLGAKKRGGLIQMIWDGYGVEETRKFIDNTQRLVNNFNLYNGFTAGVGAAGVTKDIAEQIDKLYNTLELETEHMITEMENNPDMMAHSVYEMKLFAKYSGIRETATKVVMNTLSPTNEIGAMAWSGSKGDPSNIGQMSGCLGMQAFEGGMVPKKYNKRTCAFYHQDDDRGVARGLVRNAFADGLEFPEFCFHLLASRLGIIDTAIRTAETGYAQRKLVKSMEDIMIKYDGTVRTANDLMLQTIYGDAGTDTTKQYEYTIDLIGMNNEEMENKFKFSKEDAIKYKLSSKESEDYFKHLLEIRDMLRRIVMRSELSYVVVTSKFMVPINLQRIIDTIKMDTSGKNKEELNAKYILGKLDEILLNKVTSLACMTQAERDDPTSLKHRDEVSHKFLLKTALHNALSPKRCISEYKLTKAQFDKIYDEIITAFTKNIVEPGELVGIIAAQSMGEQLTQFTLSNFHHAGIASVANTTQGVSRIKELYSVSKNPKTPQMVVYLNDDVKTNREMSHKIASHIKYTTLGDIRGRTNVYYDPLPKAKGSITEKDNIKHLFYNHNGNKSSCQGDINGLPWLLRIEIEREKMLEKEVTMLEIKSKFCSWWEKRFSDPKSTKKEEKKVINKITQLSVSSNSDNDSVPILHIRFNVKDADKEKDQFNFDTINQFLKNVIDTFKLKGISSIKDITATNEEQVMTINKTTGNIDKEKHFVIYAAGVNMTDIRYLIGVDVLKTISNDIVEMYNTFGIEVARSILLKEIYGAYEKAGGEVNYQHVSLIVDLMTASGSLTSIDRHGMSKTDTEPLSRASFEKSVEQLLTASVFGEIDHMKGISARIMAGSVINGGTGYCDVVLDTEMIEKSEITDEVDYMKKFTELAPSTIATDIRKQGKKSGFFVPEE